MFVGKKLHHIYLFVLLQTQKKCTFEKRKCHEKLKNCSQDHWAYKNFLIKTWDKITDIIYCEIKLFQLQITQKQLKIYEMLQCKNIEMKKLDYYNSNEYFQRVSHLWENLVIWFYELQLFTWSNKIACLMIFYIKPAAIFLGLFAK